MIWGVVILSILVILLFSLYRKALGETDAIRSMFIMAVFDPEFCQGQHDKINGYLKSITANNAMEVGYQFIGAFDDMAVRLAKGSLLLGANAALWSAFKKAKQETDSK